MIGRLATGVCRVVRECSDVVDWTRSPIRVVERGSVDSVSIFTTTTSRAITFTSGHAARIEQHSGGQLDSGLRVSRRSFRAGLGLSCVGWVGFMFGTLFGIVTPRATHPAPEHCDSGRVGAPQSVGAK